MPEENINQEFRSKKMDEIRNYLIEEINRNDLLSKKHKKVIVISSITGFVSISAFASLVLFLYKLQVLQLV